MLAHLKIIDINVEINGDIIFQTSVYDPCIRKTLKVVSRNKKTMFTVGLCQCQFIRQLVFQTDLKISDMRFLDPQAPINLFVGKGPSLLANGWIMCEISRTLDVKISTSCRSVLVDISVVE